jgi:SAM-dependent methyltransferase
MKKYKAKKKSFEEPEPIKVNLACGQTKEEGWIGVDYVKAKGVDIVHNLNKYPWPFKDASVDEVFASHYLEHIPHDIPKHPDRDGLFLFMDEVYRILKPGGKAVFITPWWNNVRCWQDPTHRRAISDATFLYFNKKWRDLNKLDHYYVTCDFDFKPGYVIQAPWNTKSEEARGFACNHYVNVISDLQKTLFKREPGQKDA